MPVRRAKRSARTHTARTGTARPAFTGGINIALKLAPHRFDATLAFYRDVLGLPVLKNSPTHAVIEHGPNRLHLDRVEHQTHAEVWLEVTTPDAPAAARALARAGVPRRDTPGARVEPLPPGFRGFWIENPAGVVTLVAEPGQ
jgi:catechol 2,3-dioxygenase-like lactoylglutathione lyase family enzyme